MGKIVVTEFVSLDGVMEAPGGEDFKHAGWTFKINRGEEGDQFKLDETRETEALLLGAEQASDLEPVADRRAQGVRLPVDLPGLCELRRVRLLRQRTDQRCIRNNDDERRAADARVVQRVSGRWQR